MRIVVRPRLFGLLGYTATCYSNQGISQAKISAAEADRLYWDPRFRGGAWTIPLGVPRDFDPFEGAEE
ncbi:MAG TPA: hypothetical protein VM537_17410 [Anaerolineae bacterium]|nr:hypothetical protein [Anaerolineae bacterium]